VPGWPACLLVDRPRADAARVNIIDVDVVKALKMDLVYNTSFLCMHIGYFCSLIVAQWGSLNSIPAHLVHVVILNAPVRNSKIKNMKFYLYKNATEDVSQIITRSLQKCFAVHILKFEIFQIT
jgi:hypothetical protein